MAWRNGSLPRALLNAARSPAVNRSTTNSSAFRRRTSPLFPNSATSTPHLPFTNTRTFGALACALSLLPVHSVVAGVRLTSFVAVDARACCELSQGT